MAHSRAKPHATRRGVPRKPRLKKGSRVYTAKKTARG